MRGGPVRRAPSSYEVKKPTTASIRAMIASDKAANRRMMGGAIRPRMTAYSAIV